jgi:hypothetical protein
MTWSRVHCWTVEFARVQLFGETIVVPKLCLDERCTDLADDEPSGPEPEHQQCEKCDRRTGSVHRRRQNTSYNDPEMNFVVQCDECFALTEEYWAAMWADYYAGLP